MSVGVKISWITKRNYKHDDVFLFFKVSGHLMTLLRAQTYKPSSSLHTGIIYKNTSSVYIVYIIPYEWEAASRSCIKYVGNFKLRTLKQEAGFNHTLSQLKIWWKTLELFFVLKVTSSSFVLELQAHNTVSLIIILSNITLVPAKRKWALN